MEGREIRGRAFDYGFRAIDHICCSSNYIGLRPPPEDTPLLEGSSGRSSRRLARNVMRLPCYTASRGPDVNTRRIDALNPSRVWEAGERRWRNVCDDLYAIGASVLPIFLDYLCNAILLLIMVYQQKIGFPWFKIVFGTGCVPQNLRNG